MKGSSKWLLEKDMLANEFEFKDFLAAVDFVNKIATVAEKLNHHPDILIHGYNKVKITLSTHSEKKVTDLDYQLASLIDHVIEKF